MTQKLPDIVVRCVVSSQIIQKMRQDGRDWHAHKPKTLLVLFWSWLYCSYVSICSLKNPYSFTFILARKFSEKSCVSCLKLLKEGRIMRKGIIVVCLSFIFVIGGAAGAFGATKPDANQVGNDDKMCWAAAASNVLVSKGWDHKYGGDAQTLFGKGFKEFCTNGGGWMRYCLGVVDSRRDKATVLWWMGYMW